MQRDNQGRALLRLPTTMRVAFEAALPSAFNRAVMGVLAAELVPNIETVKNVERAVGSNHGYRKVPAWTVTRKGKR